ncbi:hypothetical protein HKCCE4037_01155 [Rhodobacterales bacterium HKCCE4037]|nr:hypothetical protein [Rhodobacterales bacterium HKCCE4037]
MSTGTADRVTLNVAAQLVLRVLIASYFLAVALNIIPGTNLGILFSAVLPEIYATATAAGLVFICSFLIMLGMATRVAALMLAIMTFFASYLVMIELGVEQELGAFWRDLALIAALLLTYGDSVHDRRLRRKLVQRVIVPRRVVASTLTRAAMGAETQVPRPRDLRAGARARAEADQKFERPARPAETPVFSSTRRDAPSAPVMDDVVDNIFADDEAWTAA